MQKFCRFITIIFVFLALQQGQAQQFDVDTLAARQFFISATALYESMSFDSSLLLFQRSSEIWLKKSCWKDFIASERSIVECYIRKGNTLKALKSILFIDSVLLRQHEAYFFDIVRVQILKSYLLTTQQRNDEAVKVIEELFRAYSDLKNETSETSALAYYTLANAHAAKNNYDISILNFNKAKEIREKLFGKDHLSLSRIYVAIGNSHFRKNDFDIALTHYNRALEILGKNSRNISDDAAYCHLYMMTTLNDMGDYYKAIEHGKKSIEIYTELNLLDNGSRIDAVGKLGEIYTTLGDFVKAKEYTEQALVLSLSKYPESINAHAVLHQRLADIYRRSGDLDKALEYTLKGIDLTEKSYGKDHPQTGFMYELSGGVFSDRKEFDKALEYYYKALVIRLNIVNRESFTDVVSIFTSISDVYMKMNNFDSAFVNLQRADSFETRSKATNIPLKALVHQRFGEYYSARKQYAKAIASYHFALQILTSTSESEKNNLTDLVRNTLYKKEACIVVIHLADAHHTLYRQRARVTDLQKALSWYTSAMNLLDDVRKQYSADGSKFILADQNKSLYAKACRTALKLYDVTKDSRYQEAALLAADRSKANALLEQLFNQEAKRFAGISDSLLQKENNLLASIVFHEVQLQKFWEKGNVETEAIQKIQSEVFALKNDHRELVEYLERNYPKYYELKYADYTVSLRDIQKHLGAGKIFFEYLSDGSVYHVFAVSNSALISKTITHADAINESAADFTSSLKKYEVESYHQSGKYLYTHLLKSFKKILTGKEHIIIVPDGALHYVPFEALPTRSYADRTSDFSRIPYLIRSHDVTYSYSASFMLKMTNESPSSSLTFSGFAPVFRDSIHNGDFLANRSYIKESGISDVRSITMDGKTFNELKYSEEELQSIGTSFQTHAIPYKNFLHTSATETNFKLFSRNYDVVHVATHGFVNEKNPKLSAILFSQPKESTAQDDGILYLNEMFALELKAKLVVLSSCESGLGTLVQGEGMMALTRGLFYAGAKNIIYSLWKVSDKQTYLLMDEFYKQMLSGKSYSSSLREAKLKLISAKESAFPSKWSGFVLMGE